VVIFAQISDFVQRKIKSCNVQNGVNLWFINGFRLVPKLVTLNDLERRSDRYISCINTLNALRLNVKLVADPNYMR